MCWDSDHDLLEGLHLVVVNDFHSMRTKIGPFEADPVLVVDSDTVLSCQLALQDLQPVARRNTKIRKPLDFIQLLKSPLSFADKSNWQQASGRMT